MLFKQFIEQVPKNEYLTAQIFMGDKVAILKPKNFLTGVEITFDDFHFSIPKLTPPPIRIGKKVYNFRKGRLLVFSPGMSSVVTTYSPCEEYYALNVDKDVWYNTALEMTGNRGITISKVDNMFSSQLMNSIYNLQYEVENFQDQCPLMLQSVSMQLVIQLIREISSNQRLSESQLIPDFEYVKKAIEYMEAYYNTNITIEDICKVIHVSQYHFIRMFNEKIGLTPHEYLLTIRIQKAKLLLQKRECSIAECAKQCGFINQGHFSSVFKKYTGVPPSVYKNSYFIVG